MTAHTLHLYKPSGDPINLYGFITSATLLSYCLHWYLLDENARNSYRIIWTKHHKQVLIIIASISLAGVIYFIWKLQHYWLPIILPAIITAVYTAPKLPALKIIKSLAHGKTFLLAFTWVYVTCVLPLLIFSDDWNMGEFIFCFSRFLLIYAICLLFDYRDRDEDIKTGLITLPARISVRNLGIYFYAIIITFICTTCLLIMYGFQSMDIIILLIPGIILAFLYPTAIRIHSDYLYYFLLDGLMILSSLMSIVIAF